MAQESDSEKIARLEREIEKLKAEIERLRRALEVALRTGKRQAAPFSRQEPKAHPEKPGRKTGDRYGRACRRPIPAAVEEIVDALLPERCPHCGGECAETGIISQYQTEIPPPRVERIAFRIHVGRCQRCGRRVHGRHSRQTSNAVGGAASQLGPRALALATQLNKGVGLPYGKTAAVMEEAFGLRVSRGGLCQALARVARKAEPTYQELVEQIRASASVTPDETGWKVGGRLWWMWVFSSPQSTVYSIQPGRGYEQAAAVLGSDFYGFLVRDGWRVYRSFSRAVHQTCVAHLLRRCREMIAVTGAGAGQLPRIVQGILQHALRLRDRRDRGHVRGHGLAVARGRLEAQLDRVLQRRYRMAVNQRFAHHLLRERDAVFPFLYCPGLEATNWRAEQAIRPMVVTRKVWGGNRTPRGAHTQGVLLSLLQTCRQHRRPIQPVFQQLLCSPHPIALNLTAPHCSPP